MPKSELPDPIQREILNLEEAAAYLGVSTKTFHKVLHEGEMPGRKVGREWKFSRRALERWIGDSRSRDFLDGEDALPADESAAAAAAAENPARRTAAAATTPRGQRARGRFDAEED